MATRRFLTITATLVAILATALAGSLVAAEHDHEHAHATPDAHDHHDEHHADGMGGTGTGVVYMTIENTGDDDDALLGGSTDRAQTVEVHEMRVQDDIGIMVAHDGPLVIPAGESVALEPAGLHIMLIDLNDDIRLGDTFDLTLEFEQAGEVTIPVTAALDAEDAEGESIEAGDLEISGVWSRPAPRIDGASPATPDASPAA